MIDRNYLIEQAERMKICIQPDQAAYFDRYASLLLSWNNKINLTAITDPKEICVKHFVDSLLLLKSVEIPDESSLIDVGCGAGFPSIPCTIVRPDTNWTLLDSLQKRVSFLDTVITELSLPAVAVHSRAEDAGKNADFREQYDFATARAVARLRELSEYCLPFVKVGGIFAALKGYEIEEELAEASSAISILGGQIERVDKYELPDHSKRSIILIRKIKSTSNAYPRTAAKMKKKPL